MTVRWKRSPRQHGEDAYPILHIFLTTDFRVQPVVSMETVLTEQLSNVLTVKINVNESSSFGRLGYCTLAGIVFRVVRVSPSA